MTNQRALDLLAAIAGASLALAIGWLIGVQVERVQAWTVRRWPHSGER